MGNIFKTAILMAALMALLLYVGGLLGGRSGMILAFMFAVIINFGTYWFSDKIVLKMYRAKEVSPEEAPTLHAIVDRLVAKAGIPKPKVYIIPNASPNAFATGRNPGHAAVAATEGIMRLLNEDELEGVIAHELSHVKNRDILIATVAATFAGAIAMLARIAQFGAIFGGGRGRRDSGNIFVILAVAIISSLVAVMIQLAISRSREYQADASGAKLCGKPMGLANALLKLEKGTQMIPTEATPATAHMFIVKPFTGGGLMGLFSTHPPIPERVRRLEEMTV